MQGLIFQLPPAADETVQGLPADLADLLRTVNGFVAYRGGLHVRGVVASPDWHSLHAVWHGDVALAKHYRSLTPNDVPFGEDAMGDQFFLRDGRVWRLRAETDEAEPMDCTLAEFLVACERDPVEFLQLHPLLQLEREGTTLQPGQLIFEYPPFCTAQGKDVRLKAVPTAERLPFLFELAAAVRDLPDGGELEIKSV